MTDDEVRISHWGGGLVLRVRTEAYNNNRSCALVVALGSPGVISFRRERWRECMLHVTLMRALKRRQGSACRDEEPHSPSRQ